MEANKRRALIVDGGDDGLADNVEGRGYSVTKCADGLGAMKAMNDGDFDLILVGDAVESPPGVDLVQYARSRLPRAHVAVVPGGPRSEPPEVTVLSYRHRDMAEHARKAREVDMKDRLSRALRKKRYCRRRIICG